MTRSANCTAVVFSLLFNGLPIVDIVNTKPYNMNDPRSGPSQKRPRLDDFELLSKDELIAKYQSQKELIEKLQANVDGSENNVKEKTSVHIARRENVLTMKLACKEQEVQEYVGQVHHIKKVQEDAALTSLRQASSEPGINLLFGKMREELQQTKDKLEQAQSELSAWKFTPDSQNGKKLIARCRALINENQELGRQLSQGKSAQLEADLALQKKYSEELKESQNELNEFVLQLDEEVEGMESTIQALKEQLNAAKEEGEKSRELITLYENEVRLKQELAEKEVQSEEDSSEELSADENQQPRSPASSTDSYQEREEGEYVSGSEVEDNTSVTSYNEVMDEYEILETVPSDDEDFSNTSPQNTSTCDASTDSYQTKHGDNRVVKRASSCDYAANGAQFHPEHRRSPDKLSTSKRRVSSSIQSVRTPEHNISSSQNYSYSNGPMADDRPHRIRRSSEHKMIRSDSRIVVSGNNNLITNSS